MLANMEAAAEKNTMPFISSWLHDMVPMRFFRLAIHRGLQIPTNRSFSGGNHPLHPPGVRGILLEW